MKSINKIHVIKSIPAKIAKKKLEIVILFYQESFQEVFDVAEKVHKQYKTRLFKVLCDFN